MMQFIISPKHSTRGATNNHSDSCLSLSASQPVLPYPQHNTAVCSFLSTTGFGTFHQFHHWFCLNGGPVAQLGRELKDPRENRERGGWGKGLCDPSLFDKNCAPLTWRLQLCLSSGCGLSILRLPAFCKRNATLEQ